MERVTLSETVKDDGNYWHSESTRTNRSIYSIYIYRKRKLVHARILKKCHYKDN